MRRPMSPQLRRQLELGAREGQARDVSNVLRATLEEWPGAPRMNAVRAAGSGATLFYVELSGHAFMVTVEPVTAEAAQRIQWESAPAAQDGHADATR